MTEETKPTKTKRAVKVTFDAAKIVMAITTLVVAYNGYRDLENKNALVLEALGSKLNALAEKVSYLEGRLQALSTAPTPGVHHLTLAKPPEPPPPENQPPAAVAAGEGVMLKAYESVPLDVAGLQQLQIEQRELKAPPGE
jgi:hypothetical protein